MRCRGPRGPKLDTINKLYGALLVEGRIEMPTVQNFLFEHTDLLLRLALNLVAMSIHVFGIYYRRYRNKEVVTAAAMFNIFIFSVLTILSSVNFGVTAGFGLFAILALFTLRSEPLEKVEMVYFFGSVAIAVICSVKSSTIALPALISLFVLLSVYVIDHPRMLRSVRSVKLFLDQIDADLLSDQEATAARLGKRLNVEVLSYEVLQLDYINEMARINVYCRTR